MLEFMKKYSSQMLACMLMAITTFTVNSACIIMLGQPEEPDSLKRLKK